MSERDIYDRLNTRTLDHADCDCIDCDALREIARLRDRIGVLEMWLCPHRERMAPDRGGDDGARQCAACLGIIHDPERLAIERAERAEAIIRRHIAWCDDAFTAEAFVDIERDERVLLADLDARASAARRPDRRIP